MRKLAGVPATALGLAVDLVMAGVAGPTRAPAQRFISIGTGGAMGVYHPTGNAIRRLVNQGRKEYGMRPCGTASHSVDRLSFMRSLSALDEVKDERQQEQSEKRYGQGLGCPGHAGEYSSESEHSGHNRDNQVGQG